MSIQGFISDRSLIDSTLPFVNLEKLNLACGFLDRDTIEYFVEPLELLDLRTDRLLIQYRQEVGISFTDQDADILTDTAVSLVTRGIERIKHYPTDTVALAQYPGMSIELDTMSSVLNSGLLHMESNPEETVTMVQYRMLDYLEFNNDIIPDYPIAVASNRELKLTIDATKLTPADKAAVESMQVDQHRRMFNVIEFLSYGTISDDSFDMINTILVSDSNKYLGYVNGSVKFNRERTISYLYGGINIHRYLPNSIEFKFRVGIHVLDIKLWINKFTFRTQYPLSTIINVIPPMDLNVMLSPTTLSNDPIDSLIISKQWSDTLMKPEIDTRDQSGMLLFETRYVFQSKTYMVTFSLIFRGRKPDAMEARNAIADYLLKSGVGTRGLWELLLPDIFYRSAFAIVPYYDAVTILTNADIYPSIINASGLLSKLDSIIRLLPRASDPYREFMTAAYDKYFIGVGPSDINESSSLLALHPTYRDFSTIDRGFSEMTALDREFSIRLNQALGMAAGEINYASMNEVISGGLKWINFTYNYCSFLVLTKESYLSLFPIQQQ